MMDEQLIDLKPIEESGAEPASPSSEEPGEWRTTAKYTSSAERCRSCQHFDPNEGHCGKYNDVVEEDGHCSSWEPGEDPGEEEGFEGDDLEEIAELE